MEDWCGKSSLNKDIFESLKDIWDERSGEQELVNGEEMIDHIWQQGVEFPRIKYKKYRDWNYIYKVAAVFVIFIIVLSAQYLFLKDSFRENTASEPLFVEKRSQAGQKTKTYLPDGSVAWLNGASVISHAPHFNDSVRLVIIQGEAFFEVAKDTLKPFVVKSGHLNTIAIGTSFNINAYPDQDLIKVSLMTGRVKIENENLPIHQTILEPGYEIIYNRKTEHVNERKFKPEEVIGWKDGKLVFKSATYDEFIGKLSKWYGVDIITYGKPPRDFFLSTTYDNESLINILKNIRFTKDFNYELKRDQLILKFE